MSKLNLNDDEFILERCKASAAIGLRSLWQGDLWVTNQRVVWRRHGFTPPYPKPGAFEIPLDLVEHAEARDFLGAFGCLYIHTTTNRHTMIPYRGIYGLGMFVNGKLAKQLALTINDTGPLSNSRGHH